MDKNKEILDQNILIAKKTEKVVTAIFLISQFLPKEESLKDSIRQEATKLLKSIFAITINNRDKEGEFLLYKESLEQVSLLISFLFVAKYSNLISEMNVDIVVEALRMLETFLNRKQLNFTRENINITEEVFFQEMILNKNFERKEILEPISTPTSLDIFTERNLNNYQNKKSLPQNKNIFKEELNFYKRQNDIINDKTEEKILNDKIESKQEKVENKTEAFLKTNSLKYISKTFNKAEKNKNRKDGRKQQILSLFSKGAEVSINDISKKIIGCSIKTLQREVNELVAENKISKTGEKRWSKYKLV